MRINVLFAGHIKSILAIRYGVRIRFKQTGNYEYKSTLFGTGSDPGLIPLNTLELLIYRIDIIQTA